MTQTQEKFAQRVIKIHKGVQGVHIGWGTLFMDWQVIAKIVEQIVL